MKLAKLTLHCGASEVQRDVLAQVPTPEATETWQPIPHIEMVNRIETALATSNMRVVNQAHSLGKDGQRYFGLLQVANCLSTGEDYCYVLGMRNSHDRSYPAGMVVGAQVFVCDNLSFSGEISLARKHTVHILRDLPMLASRAIGMLSEKWNNMTQRIENYKSAEMDDKAAHDFIIRSVDAGATTYAQVPLILQEWRKPRHAEFAEKHNAWRLFNAFTEASKMSSLALLPKRTITLHGLMDAQVGFAAVSKAATIVGDATDTDVVVANN